jgi:hypothetical protein
MSAREWIGSRDGKCSEIPSFYPSNAVMSSLRSPLLRAVSFVLALGTLIALIYFAHLQETWSRKGLLEPSGGRYFFRRVELPVPLFRQSDDRWRHDLLGPTPNTLGAEGCAVASAAMVLASYGYDTDPQRLNVFLKANQGFTPQGWLYWEKAAELAGGHVRHAYEDLPSYELIDRNLARGNPVIVRLRLPSRITHFVVITGKEGFDYLTRDPGAGASKGLYPLREFGSRIEALRFYEKLP